MSNNSLAHSSNSFPNKAGSVGKLLSNFKPKYILGEFTTNLLASDDSLGSFWSLVSK